MTDFTLPEIIERLREHWTAPDYERHFRAALTRTAFLEERRARATWPPDAAASQSEERDHEALEWFGDRVLALVVAEHLWTAFPDAEPGRLDRALDALVSTGPLAEIAREIGLDNDGALRMGAGEHKQDQAHQDKPLAAHVEALFGAAYQAGGLDGARALIEALYKDRWPDEPPEQGGGEGSDNMSRLNELVQKRWRRSLEKSEWDVVSDGAKAPLWKATVELPDGLGSVCAEGWFKSKAEAKEATAGVAVGVVFGAS